MKRTALLQSFDLADKFAVDQINMKFSFSKTALSAKLKVIHLSVKYQLYSSFGNYHPFGKNHAFCRKYLAKSRVGARLFVGGGIVGGNKNSAYMKRTALRQSFDLADKFLVPPAKRSAFGAPC